MADYTAPFHLPRHPPGWWKAARRRAIRKKGYKVRIPNLKDIIHVPVWDPLTPEEERQYRKGKRGNISPERWHEIQDMEQYRQDKYDAMLRSAAPDILQSRSSLMAALDDAEDALSTAGIVTRLIGPLLPAAIADLLEGPLGWMLTAADLLNLANMLLAPELKPIQSKRHIENLLAENPFSREARAKKVDDYLHRGLGIGGLLEAAQVSDNIYGVGVCLGPIMALPETIGSGLVRMAMGQKVDWEVAKPDWGYWGHACSKLMHSALSIFGDTPWLTRDEYAAVHLALLAAHQYLGAYPEATQAWKTFKHVHSVHFRAPIPTNPITLKVIADHHDDPIQTTAWPQTGTTWANFKTLKDKTIDRAHKNLEEYYKSGSHDIKTFMVACNICQLPMYAIANSTSADNLDKGYSIPARAAFTMLTTNHRMAPGTTQGQIKALAEDLEHLQSRKGHEHGRNMMRTLKRYGRRHGIKFVQYTGH